MCIFNLRLEQLDFASSTSIKIGLGTQSKIEGAQNKIGTILKTKTVLGNNTGFESIRIVLTFLDGLKCVKI